MDMTPGTKISIRGLSFFFNKKQVLKNIDLDIPEKKVTAILGASGSGKSTLLRSINRIYEVSGGEPRDAPPSGSRHAGAKIRIEGQILLDGQNILSKETDLNLLRTRVGMIFQTPDIFPMSIYENIAFGLRLLPPRLSKPELTQQIEQALRAAALWDEVKDRLHESALALSGGQKQRLCIARAIAVRPEVLLMDEPCSSLDPIATAKIEELIDELRQKYTIVIVTHNIAQAKRCSDYIAFMHEGELVEFNNTAEMAIRPKHHMTEAFLTGRFG